MADIYLIANGAMPTTAALAKVATGTNIKTMLQVKLGTQSMGRVVEWGISFDGTTATTPIACELLETGTVFATVTAHASTGIVKYGDPNAVDPTTSAFILTTTGTGFTSTNEGTITASRLFDAVLLPPTGLYVLQFPLGREPRINISTALRIRVTASATVNCYCWVKVEV